MIADDQGHFVYAGSQNYGSSTSVTTGATWPFPTAPTRLGYLRPMDHETRVVRFRIEGIRVTEE